MQENQLIATAAWAASLMFVLIGIVVFVLLFSQRRQLLYRARLNASAHANEMLSTRVEMQDQTLQLFGQELHDNIGQLLSSVKMFLALTEQTMEQVPAQFKTATDTLSKAIKEVRSLSKSFNSEWLNQFSLFENLQHETERINSAAAIQMQLNVPSSTLPLSADAQIMIFRVVQEAIQNSIKHAQATSISIDAVMDEVQLRIKISDNGVGFSVDQKYPAGVGQMNMRNRTELLQGAIAWKSERGKGTDVTITIPFLGEPKEATKQKTAYPWPQSLQICESVEKSSR